MDKQPWICCRFDGTAVVNLKPNFNCIVGVRFKVSPYPLLLFVCYCMVLWVTSAQTCLDTPGDFCSSSRRINLLWVPSSGVAVWTAGTGVFLSAHSLWVLTQVPDTWHKPTLLCCRLNLAKAFWLYHSITMPYLFIFKNKIFIYYRCSGVSTIPICISTWETFFSCELASPPDFKCLSTRGKLTPKCKWTVSCMFVQ